MRLGIRLLVLILVVPVLFVLCSRRRSERLANADHTRIDDARLRARDTTRTLGPGDIRITNSDQSIELALIGDSIVTGFGAKVLDKIKSETDTTRVKGDGFGASIEKMVRSTVAGALSHQLLFPVKNISDVRYESERLQFYNADGSRMRLFENSKVDGKDASMTFSKEDADRFIAAFHARKATIRS